MAPILAPSATPIQSQGVPPGPPIYFEGEGLTPAQQAVIRREIISWPPSFFEILAPGGALRVAVLSDTDFTRLFPNPLSSSLAWEPGLLFLRRASWNDDPMTFSILLEPLRKMLTKPTGPPKPRPLPEAAPLLPLNLRHLEANIRQFATNGVSYKPFRMLSAELALRQVAGESGGGSHQVRLKTTNPVFNHWFYRRFVDRLVELNPALDPTLQFYLGTTASVATNPAAVVATAQWGTDAHLTLLGTYHVYLDSNVQHRVRSSTPIPLDGLAVELFPRIESSDRRLKFGASVAGVVFPDLGVRGSLVGAYLF